MRVLNQFLSISSNSRVQNNIEHVDDYMWIKRVISSCDTHSQLMSCYKIIRLFHSKYKYKDIDLREYLEEHIANMVKELTNSNEVKI